jgi:hypothetical protein
MSTDTKARVTTQVYEVYIRATPEAIWDAITSPEWTVKYGYKGAVEYELRRGGAYRAYSPPEMRAMGMPDVELTAKSSRPMHRVGWCTPIAFCSRPR